MSLEATDFGRGSIFTEPSPRPKGRPGPKPGGFNPGAFNRGPDERRHINGPCAERLALRRSIEDMAKEHAEDALMAIAELVTSDDTPPKVRLEAAAEILDRGYGSVVTRAVIGTINDAGADIDDSNMEAIGRRVASVMARLEVISDQ